MEMDGGRGFSELLRNTSDEMFIKTIMENPIGVAAPSMEMMGFRNISQSFRGDSEELFNSWLMNAEVSGHGSGSISHRTRQASKRISTELATIQQNGSPLQKKSVNENLHQQGMSKPEEHFIDSNQQSPRNAAEKGIEASNLYLAKAWFHSSQPMTRSRSSELRMKIFRDRLIKLTMGSFTNNLSSGRPHDRVTLKEMKDDWHSCLDNKVGFKGLAVPKESRSKVVDFKFQRQLAQMRYGDVIAAITSCTNTSNRSVMLGAALVAKKACEIGLEHHLQHKYGKEKPTSVILLIKQTSTASSD